MHPSKKTTLLIITSGFIVSILTISYLLSLDATKRYQDELSVSMYDQHGKLLKVFPNKRDNYVIETHTLPESFVTLLIEKEDKLFGVHPGIDSISTLRAILSFLTEGHAGGASTIPQQLAKNILGNESERTLINKVVESIYAISLTFWKSNDEILYMYANTVSLGNQVQGFETASFAYYGKKLDETTTFEQIGLLATLSNPTLRNPWAKEHEEYAHALYERLGNDEPYVLPLTNDTFTFTSNAAIELAQSGVHCDTSCTTTIDEAVTETARSILARYIDRERERGARNGAIIIIDARKHSLLALVGSPNPLSVTDGAQINMALEPRPIGSTVKPFIYLKGFEDGLRPYTLVEDREYKYPIATGFSLYPKNYDGVYHGEITLHEALSNSFNVPSVKVLEYIGLRDFYTFLREQLGFTPIQDFDAYQYGIALGGLEMDLLSLTQLFTLFPNEGTLYPLSAVKNMPTQGALTPQVQNDGIRHTSDPKYVELVHDIISDRLSGVEQFGLKSTLNLTFPEYGVKTGTSRDFHDSWVVGYTKDFVVGVWIGNSENTPLEQVSGQSGAGSVWHDVMEYLFSTPYHTGAPFEKKYSTKVSIDDGRAWALFDDVINEHQALLEDDFIITSPQDDDVFEYTNNTHIPLRAAEVVTWRVNGTTLGVGTEVTFTPSRVGTFEIEALTDGGQREIISIRVTSPE